MKPFDKVFFIFLLFDFIKVITIEMSIHDNNVYMFQTTIRQTNLS